MAFGYEIVFGSEIGQVKAKFKMSLNDAILKLKSSKSNSKEVY